MIKIFHDRHQRNSTAIGVDYDSIKKKKDNDIILDKKIENRDAFHVLKNVSDPNF